MNLDRIIAVRNDRTVYREGDSAVKLYDDSYSPTAVLSEALNQASVCETGLRVPRVRRATQAEGGWAIVSDYIRGRTLDQLIAAQPAQAEALMARFVDLQAEIHVKRCPKLARMRDALHAGISRAQLDATTRYALHTRLDAMPRQSQLCHGNFCPQNVIIDDGDEAYLLDWPRATQGNPAADAARSYQLWCLSGDAPGAKRYLELYCGRTDTAAQLVHAWLPIVAAAYLADANSRERAELMRWIEKVNIDREDETL